jgi:glycerate kinase
VISRTVLIAPETIETGFDPRLVAGAIGRGIESGDPTLRVDLCPLNGGTPDAVGISELLARVDFDTRMRAARALVVSTAFLDEATLLGSTTFEIATRARQSGVAAYAVVGVNALSAFDARILDLQVIIEARGTRALRRAGEKLAELV